MSMPSPEDVQEMYRDFYFGKGKEDPSVTTRLVNIESDVRAIRADVDAHTRMLEGETGLDRLIRDFLAEQKGKGSRDALFRWMATAGIAALVGLLEWHPWR